MTSDFRHGRRSSRIAALVTGAGILIWLSFEDRDDRSALFFALLICSLAGVFLFQRVSSGAAPPFLVFLLVGGVCGLAVPIAAVLLMVLKTGLHSHTAPDYTLADLLSVLLRTPLWAAVGLLSGLSAGLWQNYRRKNQRGM
jgi:hypothetical protein